MPLEDLGRLVLAKRTKSGLGLRAAAKEIGVSHPTLARVEKGFLPDLANYEKFQKWLGVDQHAAPAKPAAGNVPMVHFRREKTLTKDTAISLAKMILAAQTAWPKSKK